MLSRGDAPKDIVFAFRKKGEHITVWTVYNAIRRSPDRRRVTRLSIGRRWNEH